MPDVMLPATFLALLAEFRPVFTELSFANWVVLSSGFIHSVGYHRVTDALRAAGPAATKHFTSYYRFFSRGRWSLDGLGLSLLALVLRLWRVEVVDLVLDDTLVRRSGKKVALGSMHGDPLLKQGGRPFSSYGHVYVVLAVHVSCSAIASTGWALPFLFRLYQGSRRGGRKNAPSDDRRCYHRRRRGVAQRRRVRLTDEHVLKGKVVQGALREDDGTVPAELRPKKTELATELILLVARKFPHVRFRVLADHLYNGKTVLHAVLSEVDNVDIVVRGRSDAALYELPQPRKPGQRGRPRTKGIRLPNPVEWAQQHPDLFETVTTHMYGKEVSVEVASFVGMAYRSLPGRLLRYVIVRDQLGFYKTDYLISTNLELPAAHVLSAYSRRWPLERTFQDTKQKLGLQDTQLQMPSSVRRHPPLTMILYSLIVIWFIQHGRDWMRKTTTYRDPWYDKTERPSFTEMLATLRRAGWAGGILDPSCPSPHLQEKLLSYLVRVVAVA